jgi:hypothetical protein
VSYYYVQHTKCVSIGSKVYPAWAPKPTTTLVLLSIPVLLASLAMPYVAVIEIPLLISYCLWWLYDRLICLGGEVCAIGMAGAVEPPSEKSGFDSFDTDYSINLVLAPHNIQELPADYPGSVPPPPVGADKTEYYEKEFRKALNRAIADDGIQGNLIKEQAVTHNAGWDFEGAFNKVNGATVLHHHQAYLHCEFEGGGIYQLLQFLYALLVLATIAAVVCSIPVLGWIACAILAGAIAILSVVGIVVALNDKGAPTVVDPKTGSTTDKVHPNKDILFVKGEWVFDSAHEGWNEVHPITYCSLVGTVKYEANDKVDWDDAIGDFMVARGTWTYDVTDPAKRAFLKTGGRPKPQDWTDWVKSFCDAVGDASHGLTVSNQQRPENQWKTHPVIDGCRPSEDPDPHTPIPH